MNTKKLTWFGSVPTSTGRQYNIFHYNRNNGYNKMILPSQCPRLDDTQRKYNESTLNSLSLLSSLTHLEWMADGFWMFSHLSTSRLLPWCNTQKHTPFSSFSFSWFSLSVVVHQKTKLLLITHAATSSRSHNKWLKQKSLPIQLCIKNLSPSHLSLH